MPLSFAHLWQNQEHSDVDVVLTQLSGVADQPSIQLTTLPGHSVLLSNSPVLSAQVSALWCKLQHKLMHLW